MMRSMLFALVLGVAAAPLAAQTQLGPNDDSESTRVATRGAAFLSLPVGARAQALSGAYSAIATGVSALYWNPAAIAFDERTRFGISLSNLYDDLDIQHLFGGFILPVGFHRLAVSINQLSSGEMVRTDEAFPAGGNPQFGSTFEWTATAIGLHYARLITDRLGVGFSGKYITEGIPGAQATFIAGDLSILFHTGVFGTTLAAALVNVGTDGRVQGSLVQNRIDQTTNNANLFPVRRTLDTEFLTRTAELPTGFRFGISAELLGGASSLLAASPDHSLMMMVDLTDRTDSPLSPTTGFEYSFRDRIFLRGGKRWAAEEQISRSFSHLLSVGGGIMFPLPGNRSLTFDYAFTSWEDLQNVQSFALEFAF